jgi:hypothetical protein
MHRVRDVVLDRHWVYPTVHPVGIETLEHEDVYIVMNDGYLDQLEEAVDMTGEGIPGIFNVLRPEDFGNLISIEELYGATPYTKTSIALVLGGEV